MLCQACENIFRGDFYSLHNSSAYLASEDRIVRMLGGDMPHRLPEPNYRTHQPDVSRLYRSALKECWICAQIFEDVCKKYMKEDLCPQDSTLAEIAKLILEDTTRIDKTDASGRNFTVYKLSKSNRVDGDDMTLRISVDYRPLSWSGTYEYNLADQRESIEGQSCSPENSISRFIDSAWPLCRAQLWLETCINKHSRCSTKTSGWLPTRLLDLNESENGIIRLVETKGNGAIGNYMTLSHCWGKADIYKLTSETACHLHAGLKISLLPRTFQRTIEVVRFLDAKYLWIDSLCIMQNSKEDWERESAQMGKVYSNGLLNIAATGSRDGEEGLFRERPSKLPLESTACYISSSWTGHSKSNFLIHRPSLPDGMLLDGPLLSRGWVLQERIMAKRILHFGKRQLYWECSEHDCCEIYPTGVPELWTRPGNGKLFKKNIPDLFIKFGSNFGVATTAISDTVDADIVPTPSDLSEAAATWRPSTPGGDPLASTATPTSADFQRLVTELWNASPIQARNFVDGVVSRGQAQSFLNEVESQMQAIDFWNSVVSIYSRCELTFEKDKLVALAGVARAMKVQLGCDYLAGMWRTDLERSLLWSVSVDSTSRRPDDYRAPSWSWASIDGIINIPERPGRESKINNKFEIEILYVSTQKKGPDEMGQVIGGALKVRGPLMTCFVQKTEDFEDLPDEYVNNDFSEIDSEDPPAWFFRINGVWDWDWNDGGPSMDIDEPLDTLFKKELHCLPILQKEISHINRYNCLLLKHTKKQGVFKRCGTIRFRPEWHGVSADRGCIAVDHFNNSKGVILNEEWFDGGEADSEGKYNITII